MQYLGLLFVWMLSANVYASESQLESLYQDNNVEGSILIESADGKLKYQYNVNNEASYIPASTFKIPNTLIILEEGLIKDASEVIA